MSAGVVIKQFSTYKVSSESLIFIEFFRDDIRRLIGTQRKDIGDFGVRKIFNYMKKKYGNQWRDLAV